MISSALYFICFAVLFFHTEKDMRWITIAGMIYILLENILYWWFLNNIYSFDFSIYLACCWFLDVSFLFLTACTLKGWSKKISLAVSIPILFCQILVVQSSSLFPSLTKFAIESSYPTFVEVIIFCYSFKFNTIPEWIKTSTIVSLVVIARLIPSMLK